MASVNHLGGLWVRSVVSYLAPGSGMTRAGSLERKKTNQQPQGKKKVIETRHGGACPKSQTLGS